MNNVEFANRMADLTMVHINDINKRYENGKMTKARYEELLESAEFQYRRFVQMGHPLAMMEFDLNHLYRSPPRTSSARELMTDRRTREAKAKSEAYKAAQRGWQESMQEGQPETAQATNPTDPAEPALITFSVSFIKYGEVTFLNRMVFHNTFTADGDDMTVRFSITGCRIDYHDGTKRWIPLSEKSLINEILADYTTYRVEYNLPDQPKESENPIWGDMDGWGGQ